jgi:hypothetical protein
MGVFVINALIRRILPGICVGLLLLTAGRVVPAQEAPEEQGADPPARAGRLAVADGAVSLQPAGVSEWNAVPVNQPLTAGDRLWTDTGSRAEIDLGEARVRLDGRSSLAILDLGDRAIQLRLDAGSIDVAVSEVADLDAFEIDAPNAAVSLLRPGEYRLSVDNASSTSVVVRNGQLQVQSSGQQNATLGTGQRGLYGDNGAYAISQAGPPDDFDLWSQQRQRRWAEDQAAAQYVSSDAVGYQDLTDYGQWQQQPDQGYAWFPNQVSDDWVPYSTGHWAWIGPWGWSWIDDAPWGFAPFHYGRWGRFGRRWGWIPCPPHHRPVYAPALVAWVGGPGVPGSPALGGGPAVGWVPLAPGEVYVPAYRASPGYLQNINLTSSRRLNPALVTSIVANPALQNHYANRDVPGAMTVVPQVNFTAGQPVQRHRMSPPAQWQAIAPMARVPAITPGHESVVGALTFSRVGTPPESLADRPVVMRRTPPSAPPSFDRQQRIIQANGARPLDQVQLRSLARPAPAIAATRPAPTRAPEYRPPPPADDDEQNVFKRRDREIEQEQQAEQRQQRRAQLPRLQPQQQDLQRLQEQQRNQEAQRAQPQQRQLPQQSAPQQRPPAAPTATPRSTPRPEFRRIPEQSSPPTPNSAR